MPDTSVPTTDSTAPTEDTAPVACMFGQPCDDGDPCTTNDMCVANVCVGAALECTSMSDSCNVGQCNPDTGMCERVPVADMTSCEDGNSCTVGDTCVSGVCTPGDGPDCTHLNGECTVGTCNTAGACIAMPANEGMGCDDGDACTTGDRCRLGMCEGGSGGGVREVRINEVFGGGGSGSLAPDFIELVNRSSCSVQLRDLTVQFHFQSVCNALGQTMGAVALGFGGETLGPNGVLRIIDTTPPGSAEEVFSGTNFCDIESGPAWVMLCEGECERDCSTTFDYVEKQGSVPVSRAYSCASFTPAPIDVAASTSSQSVTRVAFSGSGAAGVASDWAIGNVSR